MTRRLQRLSRANETKFADLGVCRLKHCWLWDVPQVTALGLPAIEKLAQAWRGFTAGRAAGRRNCKMRPAVASRGVVYESELIPVTDVS